MERVLQDRVALITGGGRGIGRAIALAFAREGARLALAARSAGQLEDTAAGCRGKGAAVVTVPTDVAQWDQVQHLVTVALKEFRSEEHHV